MKLYIGNKNTPFALDVTLDGSSLSLSARDVIQRSFVGDPSLVHPNGAKYFDRARISEWRGDFGVYGDPIYERTIDIESLRGHPEFGDHAAFMINAPIGLAAEPASRPSLYERTPNLYAMTLASKMEAQAYYATVIQSHPLGQILVPLASHPTSEWTLGFNLFDPSLISVSGDIQIAQAITLGIVREETLPVVRFIGPQTIDVDPSSETEIQFRLETPTGDPISGYEADVYLDATSGYLVSRRVRTVGGVGSTVFRPDGLGSGSQAKIKVGFKWFSGTDDLMVTIA